MIDTESLRKKVIDLAIQGKLTEQLSSDGDAETLYAQIQEEKKRLIQKGLLRKTRGFNDITEDMIPFSFPDQWRVCYIDDIAFVTKLAGFEYTKYIADSICEEGIPLFKGKNIQKGELVLNFESYIPQSVSDELPRSKVCKKCLLTPYVGTIGNIALFNGDFDAHLGSNVGKIEILNPISICLMEEYLLYYLRSSIGYTELTKHKKATAQDSISIDAIRNVIISIPPIEEQKRIVDKIDAVLAQLDIIDGLQAKYRNDLAVLKSKIIDAGIQGKLTEHLPEDGDANDLIARITEEKDNLIRNGKIPKEKKLPDISEDEIPFEIPESWRWARVQDVASYITDYVANGSFATLKAHTKTYKEPNYAIFVRTLDFGTNFKEGCSYIDQESYDFLEKSKLYGGELILPNIGASIGKAFIMPDLGMPMSLAPNSILVKFTEPVMNEFFSYVVKSTYGNKLLNKTQGGSATAKFSKTDLRNLVVPLPPLDEIKRIVESIKVISQIMK